MKVAGVFETYLVEMDVGVHAAGHDERMLCVDSGLGREDGLQVLTHYEDLAVADDDVLTGVYIGSRDLVSCESLSWC